MRAVSGGYMSSSPRTTWKDGGTDAFPSPGSTGPRPGSAGDDVDLTGYPIAAVDGDIGHVDEATYEARVVVPGGGHRAVDLRPQGVAAGRCGRADRHRREEGVRRPDQGPDQGRTRVRPDRRRRHVSGPARRLLRRDVQHAQTPGCDPGAGGQASDACRAASKESGIPRSSPGSRFLLWPGGGRHRCCRNYEHRAAAADSTA